MAFTGWPVLVLRLGLTAGAAELSYRYVEQPWRTGRAQAALRSFAAANPPWRLVAGAAAAQGIQLQIEYAPAPPFDAGTPDTAPADVLAAARRRYASTRGAREALVARIAETFAA